MPRNTLVPAAAPAVDTFIVRAQTRLLKRYAELKGNGGWPALAREIGCNVSYVYNLATHGKWPSNLDVQEAMRAWLNPKEKKPMDGPMRKLLNLMQWHHVGVERAIKKRDLLTELYGQDVAHDESYNNPYDRELRGMIEVLNHDHGGLICSTPAAGYFWASSLNEGMRAVEHLEKRAHTQLENTSHLKRNLQRRFGGQLGMDI